MAFIIFSSTSFIAEGSSTSKPIERPSLAALALSSQGYALESLSKWTEAREQFEKGFNLGLASMKGELMMGMARTSEQLNEPEKAKEIYGRIMADLQNTDYARTAEVYSSLLERKQTLSTN